MPSTPGKQWWVLLIGVYIDIHIILHGLTSINSSSHRQTLIALVHDKDLIIAFNYLLNIYIFVQIKVLLSYDVFRIIHICST